MANLKRDLSGGVAISSRPRCFLFAFFTLLFLTASPQSYAQTQIVVPCDSVMHSSQWFSLSPDGSQSFKIVASNAGGQNCNIQTTTWSRNHWTPTCWVTWSSSSETDYTCHNWNTVFGDSWSIQFSYMACPASGCTTDPKVTSVIENVQRALNREGAGLMHSHK